MNAFGLTDRGTGRERNEDSIVLDRKAMLYMVADGMGGHCDGGVASRKAVTTITHVMRRNIASCDNVSLTLDAPVLAMIGEAVQTANREIYEYARGKVMGTTLSFAHFNNGKLYIAHIGDSRIYRLRNRVMEKLTEDHTQARDLEKAGLISPEKAENHLLSHILTRALGSSSSADPDLASHPVKKGDVYLICSDGLFRVLAMDEVKESLSERGVSAETKCRILMEKALQRGAPDNVSIIVIEIRGFFSRLLSMRKHRFMCHKG